MTEAAEILLEYQVASQIYKDLVGADRSLSQELHKNKYNIQAKAQHEKIKHDLAIMHNVVGGTGLIVAQMFEQKYKVKFKFLVAKVEAEKPALTLDKSDEPVI